MGIPRRYGIWNDAGRGSREPSTEREGAKGMERDKGDFERESCVAIESVSFSSTWESASLPEVSIPNSVLHLPPQPFQSKNFVKPRLRITDSVKVGSSIIWLLCAKASSPK
jgi:hypothetical protein